MKSIEIEKTFTQTDFDRFAEFSGDDNPIHVDPEFSAKSRFGRTAAHGMLLSSVFRGMLFRLLPDAEQLSQDLMFTAPTFAGEAMRFALDLEQTEAGQFVATMSCTRVADDIVTCTGQATLTAQRSLQ